jgi:acetyl-CoA synthetase
MHYEEKDGFFIPSDEVTENANVNQYNNLISETQDDPVKFWSEVAEELEWHTPWSKTLDDSNPPFYRWFEEGKVNIVHNAVDWHVKTALRNKLAIYWLGENGETKGFTYHGLYREVCRSASLLKNMGIKKGDRVSILLPRIPEQIIMMLACAKIGAVHHVIYTGLDSRTIQQQILSVGAKCIITSDGRYYKGAMIPVKKELDEAIAKAPLVKTVIVVKRTGQEVYMETGRDFWFHELMELPIITTKVETEPMDSEAPLFILYRPHIAHRTGFVPGYLYTHGGYMVGAYLTTKLKYDLKEIDRYWCTSDPAWITGHTNTVYGPLLNGASSLFYEGGLDYPYPDKWCSLIEKHQINIFATLVSNLKTLISYGNEWVDRHDLSSLRILGTMDEPMDLKTWGWYFKVIGKERCPIIDSWGQIETGGALISSLPTTPLKPGSVALALPGIEADVVDDQGNSLGSEKEGYLVIKKPWPYMCRTVYNNPEVYRARYWSKIKGVYYTGDVAKRDSEGYISIIRRIGY